MPCRNGSLPGLHLMCRVGFAIAAQAWSAARRSLTARSSIRPAQCSPLPVRNLAPFVQPQRHGLSACRALIPLASCFADHRHRCFTLGTLCSVSRGGRLRGQRCLQRGPVHDFARPQPGQQRRYRTLAPLCLPTCLVVKCWLQRIRGAACTLWLER